MNKKLNLWMNTVLFGMLFSVHQANAVNLNFSGTLGIPGCVVNNNTDIGITFPAMDIQTVSDVSSPSVNPVTQSVTLDCPYSVGTPYVMITGTGMSGQTQPTNILATSQTKLGIALYQGSVISASNKLLLGAGTGKGYNGTVGMTGTGRARTFTLTAVPVTSDYTQLTAGNYTASASIAVIYQ